MEPKTNQLHQPIMYPMVMDFHLITMCVHRGVSLTHYRKQERISESHPCVLVKTVSSFNAELHISNFKIHRWCN